MACGSVVGLDPAYNAAGVFDRLTHLIPRKSEGWQVTACGKAVTLHSGTYVPFKVLTPGTPPSCLWCCVGAGFRVL